MLASAAMLRRSAPTSLFGFGAICRAAVMVAMMASGPSSSVWAQTPATTNPVAPVPTYRVGDRWVLVYGKTAIESTVTSVTDTQTIFAETKNWGTPYELAFDAQGNLLRSGDTSYEPCLCSLSFPMSVGKSWYARWTVRNPSGSHQVEAHVSVEAFERVKVRAGEFDAFRLVMHGISTYQGVSLFNVPWDATFWYAPAVKRVVKSESVSYVRYQGSRTEKFELYDFSLAP
ncbi:hypothetical protein [Paraburkholderia oxyphila]|uniref:hypothetical protein n=1 Tax=Paraburkholderia oxyphila TaxID=614212 RepID=UPI000481C7AB|nr:hypothetical protein [Paraburkholderia oxyphila]